MNDTKILHCETVTPLLKEALGMQMANFYHKSA